MTTQIKVIALGAVAALFVASLMSTDVLSTGTESKKQNETIHATHVDVNTCTNDPRLVEIDIDKDNISNPKQDKFRFYAKLINPSVEPGELLYRWVVRAPEGSNVSTEPQTTMRMTLEPDIWGTYHIILSLGDKGNNCRHGIFVFNYPEIDPSSEDLPFFLQAYLMH